MQENKEYKNLINVDGYYKNYWDHGLLSEMISRNVINILFNRRMTTQLPCLPKISDLISRMSLSQFMLLEFF